MTLTKEQLDVVGAPIEERQLVIAGPGTGKTHTLVARIKHLIDDTEAAAGQEILVLSFTRNAVREIKRRLALSGGDAAYVRASTFDSFATQTLGALAPGEPWTSEGYEGRIRELTRQLDATPDEVLETIGDLRHILVDEVQDLVAHRAEMVKSLLTTGDFGFTILGDPAQAIYDYQEVVPGAGTFVEWARARFKRLTVRTLTGNHRIKENAARAALWAGPALGRPKPSKKTHEQLRETYRSLPVMPGWRPLGAAAEQGRAAVLCRTNGQALIVSEKLHEESVPHFLQGDASAAPIEAWVSRIFSDHAVSSITRDDLDYLLEERAPGSDVNRDEAWRALRALGKSGKLVDLGQVATRLVQRWMPDSLVQPIRAQLVVSSIHRAKGLEFEHVVVIRQPNGYDDEGQEGLEESRVLYVALTRASRTIYRYELAPLWGLIFRDADDRWVLKGRENWSRRGIQFLANDVERATPLADRDAGGGEIQDYLWNKVNRGDSVTLEADRRTAMQDPSYLIMHSGRCIGRTSTTFAAAMGREFGKTNWWPRRVSSVRVSTVESVAGTRAEAERAGLEGQGFWLAVRLEGLGRFDWSSGKFPDDPNGRTASVRTGRSAVVMPSGSLSPPGIVPSPKDRQGRKELWARLQELADAGDFEGIQRELPSTWEDKRPGLLDRARRAARRNNNL